MNNHGECRDREARLLHSLKTIAAYMPPDRLRRDSEKLYGFTYHEALENAYDNVRFEALQAVKCAKKWKAMKDEH